MHQPNTMVKSTQQFVGADELFECVWPFFGVGTFDGLIKRFLFSDMHSCPISELRCCESSPNLLP